MEKLTPNDDVRELSRQVFRVCEYEDTEVRQSLASAGQLLELSRRSTCTHMCPRATAMWQVSFTCGTS